MFILLASDAFIILYTEQMIRTIFSDIFFAKITVVFIPFFLFLSLFSSAIYFTFATHFF